MKKIYYFLIAFRMISRYAMQEKPLESVVHGIVEKAESMNLIDSKHKMNIKMALSDCLRQPQREQVLEDFKGWLNQSKEEPFVEFWKLVVAHIFFRTFSYSWNVRETAQALWLNHLMYNLLRPYSNRHPITPKEINDIFFFFFYDNFLQNLFQSYNYQNFFDENLLQNKEELKNRQTILNNIIQLYGKQIQELDNFLNKLSEIMDKKESVKTVMVPQPKKRKKKTKKQLITIKKITPEEQAQTDAENKKKQEKLLKEIKEKQESQTLFSRLQSTIKQYPWIAGGTIFGLAATLSIFIAKKYRAMWK